MSGRGLKVSQAIKKEIADILSREIKDPRIGFITITDVTMHDDLKIATVYFTVFGDEVQKDDAMQGLESASGYIRRLVGKRVRLKTVPEIVFKYDETLDKSKKLDELFEQIDHEKGLENESSEESGE